jgi:hypothetical protein
MAKEREGEGKVVSSSDEMAKVVLDPTLDE